MNVDKTSPGSPMEDTIKDINDAFSSYASSIEEEGTLRENISLANKDLEKTAYAAFTILEKVHHSQGLQNVSVVCAEADKELSKAPAQYERLRLLVPRGEFYKYHPQFRSTSHRLIHACVFNAYLQENRLLEHSEVAVKLGLCTTREEGFHLDLEDYLQGCLAIGHDLSRLSVNAVSTGDFGRPFQISEFLRDLHAAYSLLNPKHDLRKKFDELKYSVKKAEEVVYNLSLRGLKPPESEKSG